MSDLLQSLQAICDLRQNVLLKAHCSFGVGGVARFVATPKTAAQLAALRRFCRGHQLPFLVVGNGSNLLFSDEGFGGVVALTTELDELCVSENTIYAQAGVSLAALCRIALSHSLAGLEFAYGIPGSVGGAIYMNAGAYDGEICNVVTEITCIDEEDNELVIPAADAHFSYRHSIFCNDRYLITGARFSLTPGEQSQIKAKMEDFMGRRRDKQPLDKKSAGSTFKRPKEGYASALIDQCGLKGLSVGDAQVSAKHAGFVVNNGSASCKDILSLCEQVKAAVKAQTGVELELEVKVITA